MFSEILENQRTCTVFGQVVNGFRKCCEMTLSCVYRCRSRNQLMATAVCSQAADSDAAALNYVIDDIPAIRTTNGAAALIIQVDNVSIPGTWTVTGPATDPLRKNFNGRFSTFLYVLPCWTGQPPTVRSSQSGKAINWSVSCCTRAVRTYKLIFLCTSFFVGPPISSTTIFQILFVLKAHMARVHLKDLVYSIH